MPVHELFPARTRRSPSGEIRYHVHHLDDSIGRFDLEALDRDLRSEPAYSAEGHCALTLAKYPDLRMVLLAMRKGSHVGDATACARLSVQTLRGRAVLHHAEGTLHLKMGQLATFDHHMGVDLEAAEDASVLLTLAWDGAAPGALV